LVALAGSTALAAASGAAAVGAAVTTADSLKTAADDLKSAYASYQIIEKNIKAAEADVDDIVAKYNTLKHDFQMSVSQDSARIALNESDYSVMTKQKIDQFDHAVDSANVSSDVKNAFKAAVHKYIELVQLRNKKIFDHDAMVVTAQALSRRILEVQVQLDRVGGAQAELLAGGHLPDEISYVSLLQQAQDSQKMLVRDLVWSECGAFSLATMDASLSTLGHSAALFSYIPSVANLIQIHNQTQADILNWEVARGPGTTKVQHDVQRVLSAADLAQLQTKRRLIVTLTQADLKPSMRQVFVTAFRVSAKPDLPSLSGVLSHMGEHIFLSQQGTTVEYAARIFPFAFNNADASVDGVSLIDITEGGVFAGFSALGSWLLEIDASVPIEKLRTLHTLILSLDIAYRAPTG